MSQLRTCPPNAAFSLSSTKLRVTFGAYLSALCGIGGGAGTDGKRAARDLIIAI
jgi:hypothetical protein